MHEALTKPLAVATFGAVRPDSRRFHVAMAGVFAIIAIAGFIPSYWAKLVNGTFDGAPIFHLHGLVLFSWIGFYFVQTALVAADRTRNHRAWGLAGIALFSVMICTTVALGIHSMQVTDRLGIGAAGRQFSVTTFVSLALLAGLFAAAIANVRRPEIHKRLMLLVMVVVVQAGVSRLFAMLFATPGTIGPPPLTATIPTGLTTDILILVAVVHDWRTRGRPHAVYVYGGSIVLAVQLLLVPIGRSATWMSFANALQHLMG